MKVFNSTESPTRSFLYDILYLTSVSTSLRHIDSELCLYDTLLCRICLACIVAIL